MSIRHDALTPLLTDGVPSDLPQTATRSTQKRSALADAARLLVEGLGAVPTTLQSCGASDTDRTNLGSDA
ncbi:MAG: hypothetical protein ACTIBZ_12520 [Corynebacterium variabile]|uniref:hypothetical protein n=3 Tax=Corynebacterium variabile TaxID=1727 RepID=UPI003F8E9785